MLKNTLSKRPKSKRLEAVIKQEDPEKGNIITVYINGGTGTVFDTNHSAQFIKYHQKLVELMNLGYDMKFE